MRACSNCCFLTLGCMRACSDCCFFSCTKLWF
jgi:hypothetical protein